MKLRDLFCDFVAAVIFRVYGDRILGMFRALDSVEMRMEHLN